MIKDREERLHRRVWELLPWYVNGTLATLEQRTVEGHLERCLRCQAELETCRRLGEAVRQTEEIAPSLHPAQLARVMARIEAEEKGLGDRHDKDRRRMFAPFRALRSGIAAAPPLIRGALAAQLLLVVGLAGFLLWRPAAEPQPGQPPAAPAIYRTLSDPETAARPPTSPDTPGTPGILVRVVFADGATEKEIRDLLLSLRGQIVSGPSALGVYTVEVPAGPDPLDRVLANLRARPKVSFAEPVNGGSGGSAR